MHQSNFEECRNGYRSGAVAAVLLERSGRVLWLLVIVEIVRLRHIIEHSKGPVGVAKTQIGNFKTAIELYRLDHKGRCPSTHEGLRALIVEPSGRQHGHWQGPYLNDVTWVPPDPWGSPYRYQSPGPDGEPYRIVCLGADRRPGGEGTAADLTCGTATSR